MNDTSTTPPEVEPKTRYVILPEELAQWAEQIKARRGGSIGGIIARHARETMKEEVREVLAETQAELDRHELGESGA